MFFVDDYFIGNVMLIDIMMFMILDWDNDVFDYNFVEFFVLGWWYKYCNCVYFNSFYLLGEIVIYGKGIIYRLWLGVFYLLRFIELKVRWVV